LFFFFLDPIDMPIFSREFANFEKGLDLLRRADPTMTVNTASTLIHIARALPMLAAGQITLREIAREMNIPYSSVIRAVEVLTDGGTTRQKALGLLEKGVHPKDRRARQFRLSEKGARLLGELDGVLAKNE
jgi:DNA-binding MarR family transcriptional regulator